MKKILIKAVVFAVASIGIYVLLDLIFGHLDSFRDYLVQAIILGVLFVLFDYLDKKGWNSWKKVGSLFKRKS